MAPRGRSLQAALAAGVAAAWPGGHVAVHLEWRAAEPHLFATLRSAGLVDTWEGRSGDPRGNATRAGGNRAGGSAELVRRCESVWARRGAGCEVCTTKSPLCYDFITAFLVVGSKLSTHLA